LGQYGYFLPAEVSACVGQGLILQPGIVPQASQGQFRPFYATLTGNPADDVYTFSAGTGQKVSTTGAAVGANVPGATASSLLAVDASGNLVSGPPTLSAVTVSRVLHPSGDMSGVSDRTQILNALATASPGSKVYLANGVYYTDQPIAWTTNVSLEGESLSEIAGSSVGNPSTYWFPYYGGLIFSGPTWPLQGVVIVQVTTGADVLQPNGIGIQQNLRNIGLSFAPAIMYQNTGHGINTIIPVTTSPYQDAGQYGSIWENVKVWGHDGNHYALQWVNPVYVHFRNFRGYGGGGIHTVLNINQGFGNYQWDDVYVLEFLGGSAHVSHFDNQNGPGALFCHYNRIQLAQIALGASQPAGTTAPTSAQLGRKVTGTWNSQYWPNTDNENGFGAVQSFLGSGNMDATQQATWPTPSLSYVPYQSQSGNPENIGMSFTFTPLATAVEQVYFGHSTQIGQALASSGAVENATLVSSPGVVRMCADADFLYWTSGYDLNRCNLDGTSQAINYLTTGGSHANGICAPGNGYLYWADSTLNTIQRASIQTGVIDPNFSIAGCSAPEAICSDGTYVYWCNNGTGDIGRATLAGGSVTQTFITGANNVGGGICTDGTYLYWTEYGNTSVARATLAGGSVNHTFIALTNKPFSVATDGTYLWIPNANNAIGQCAVAGTGLNEAFISALGYVPLSVVATTPPADATVTAWITTGSNVGKTSTPTPALQAGVWSVPAGGAPQTMTCTPAGPVPSGGQYAFKWRNCTPGSKFGSFPLSGSSPGW
jgi:hypothetical protein